MFVRISLRLFLVDGQVPCFFSEKTIHLYDFVSIVQVVVFVDLGFILVNLWFLYFPVFFCLTRFQPPYIDQPPAC